VARKYNAHLDCDAISEHMQFYGTDGDLGIHGLGSAYTHVQAMYRRPTQPNINLRFLSKMVGSGQMKSLNVILNK